MRLGCQGLKEVVARSRGGEGVLARRRVGERSLASPSSPGRRRGKVKIAATPRRLFLGIPITVGLGLGLLESQSPGVARAEEGKYQRTKLGVPYEDVYLGSGDKEAKLGDVVVVDYVLRRSNGYFIYGTVEGVSFQPSDVPAEPFRFTVGDESVIEGLSDVVVGMSKGGKRRALIPPKLGYTPFKEEFANQPKSLTLEPIPPTFATKRQLLNHCNEPLLFEIQVVKIV